MFECDGNVYDTYYSKEWSQMPAAERAEYHSIIDYQTAHGEYMTYFGNEIHPQPNPNNIGIKIKRVILGNFFLLE